MDTLVIFFISHTGIFTEVKLLYYIYMLTLKLHELHLSIGFVFPSISKWNCPLKHFIQKLMRLLFICRSSFLRGIAEASVFSLLMLRLLSSSSVDSIIILKTFSILCMFSSRNWYLSLNCLQKWASDSLWFCFPLAIAAHDSSMFYLISGRKSSGSTSH